MTSQGDIHFADLNEERRRRVLVASTARFNRVARRAVVVPEVFGEHDEVQFPWRIESDDAVFAVDLLRTIPVERLLRRTGRASHETMQHVLRAIRHIT
jgi:mRNA-degrading endonuclease toxin of MazEF toxin-antitoxin module